jgi:hypothetical protein
MTRDRMPCGDVVEAVNECRANLRGEGKGNDEKDEGRPYKETCRPARQREPLTPSVFHRASSQPPVNPARLSPRSIYGLFFMRFQTNPLRRFSIMIAIGP